MKVGPGGVKLEILGLKAVLLGGLQFDVFDKPGDAVADGAEFPLSVHGSKTMRVNAEEMCELTRQFRELATANRGRYDGWSSK